MKLNALRAEISRIERRPAAFQPAGDRAIWQTGYGIMDKALPGQRLALNALHDFSVARPRDTPAMDRFVLALLQRLPVPGGNIIVWCQSRHTIREYGRPYGPGLQAIGFAPERLVLVSPNKERDLAFVMEESLRSGAVAAVIGEGEPVGFTTTRRLSLACQEMAIPCLFLNTTMVRKASAATTRWRIAPAIGPPDINDRHGPGPLAWSIVLSRARGGRAHPDSKPLEIFWNNETHSFHPLPPLRHRTLANCPKTRPPFCTARPEKKVS